MVRVAEGSEITDIATFTEPGSRLRVAVATRERIICRLDFNSDTMWEIFGVRLERTLPKAVAFAENGADLWVLGMYDGNLYVNPGSEVTVLMRSLPTACMCNRRPQHMLRMW